jgi:hypothetical protein
MSGVVIWDLMCYADSFQGVVGGWSSMWIGMLIN